MLKSTDISVKRASNSLKTVYLLFTIAGSIAPWYWLLQDPATLLSPTLFLQATFANNITTAWASDLIISAIAFFCFVWIELKRLNFSRLWLLLYIGLTFGVGLSCSLPFFLYRREQMLEQTSVS
jgi:ABC-type multidrug transport system permease subunit